MRAFMLVENYHLRTRWAFEAISEQIKLLQLKLKRTVTICASVLPRDQLLLEEQQSLIMEETTTLAENDSYQKICE